MQEHLIVDGNNALHAVPQLARTLIKDRQMARDELVRMLEPLQTRENCLLTLVFDGRGGKSVINQHRGNDNYSIIFSSSSQGADGVIERMMMAAEFPERITVCTNDNLIRNCGYANGAAVMRIDQLIKKLDATHELNKNLSRKANRQEEKFENRIPFPD